MGTSADRAAGTGGDWTPLKRATTAYVNGLRRGGDSPGRARTVIARHVPLLGGVGGASSSARAGSRGITRLGGLVSGIGAGSPADAFVALGLGRLIGKDRFTVLDELVTFIAGTGDDLDSSAARDAACDVLDELFGDAESWQDIEAISVDTGDLSTILERFLALYVYNRVPVVAERLSQLTDPNAIRQADREMRQIIADLVAIHLPAEPLAVDWAGSEGKQIANDAIASTYDLLAALEDDGD